MARRRSSPRRRTYRRRYRRNPSFKLMKGLDIQTAATAAAGGALAKFLTTQLAARVPQLADPKIKAIATLGVGVAIQALPLGSPSMRKTLGLGGQIAGITSLLAELMPGTFGAVVDASDVNVLSAGTLEVPMELEETMDGFGDELDPAIDATF